MSRKSKSRTRRNNYKSKSGKYKKVRKTQRRTRRNRQRGGGNFINKLRGSVGAIRAKGRDLKSRMRTYATDRTWEKQPKKNLEALRDVADWLYEDKDTRIDAKLEKDEQYQRTKRKYDNMGKIITDPEIAAGRNWAHLERAKTYGALKERQRELAKTTKSIKYDGISSDGLPYMSRRQRSGFADDGWWERRMDSDK